MLPRDLIVVIEGLYLFLDEEPWRTAGGLLDERIWLDIEPSVARSRLIRRHLETGVEDTLEAAERRGPSVNPVSSPPPFVLGPSR